MKRFLLVIFIALSLTGKAFPGDIYPTSSIDRLQKNINRVIDNSTIKKENIGIKIVSLKNNDVIFSHNEDKLFIPASNVKLVTSAAALTKLYPDYTFKTKVYTDGPIMNETLKGDLYLKSFGDPMLVSEQLWLITRDVYNRGIRTINGDIVVGDDYFDEKRRGKGWKKNCGPQAYNAPIGASSLNFNVITLYIEPGDKIGAKGKIIVEPQTEYIEINNQTITTAKTRQPLSIRRISNGDQDKVVITGKIPIRSKRIRLYRNISNPPLYLGTVFREFLIKEGIRIKGSVRVGTVPRNAREIGVHQSIALFRIIQYLNKFSNNFVAEQILKTMGAELKNEPGTSEKGIEVIKEFLEGIGVPKDTYVIADGSGLSPLNRLTPSQLIKVLSYMYDNFQVQGEFFSSLGVMGVDGSVDDRLENTPAKRRIRAKTGTLYGVSSISGDSQAERDPGVLDTYQSGECQPSLMQKRSEQNTPFAAKFLPIILKNLMI
jgi:D-alanyl-D-alanine carboxypeptidase/D-alanyl-D-alanine-endopeptidase (penicillin-binding protein 4)